MFRPLLAASIAACALTAGIAGAATVTPVFEFVGTDTTTAEGTALFRSDLTGLGLDRISRILVTDSNSGIGGSSGAYSGFDLDAIFLDMDGELTTASDRTYASSFAFAAGTLRPGTEVSNTAGALNGSASDTAVDEAFATLNTIDSRFFGAGSLTLGDGGSLAALFSTEVASGSPLFLFIGEVGLDGESLSGQITISDSVPPVEPPAVPLPASALLLLGGLGGFSALRRRRKA